MTATTTMTATITTTAMTAMTINCTKLLFQNKTFINIKHLVVF